MKKIYSIAILPILSKNIELATRIRVFLLKNNLLSGIQFPENISSSDALISLADILREVKYLLLSFCEISEAFITIFS